MSTAFSSASVGSVVQECPLRKPPHWIEIELIGEDGKPLDGVQYRIELPTGEVASGTLDSDGYARIDGIDSAGACRIGFPELDREAWEYVETAGPRGMKA